MSVSVWREVIDYRLAGTCVAQSLERGPRNFSLIRARGQGSVRP